MALGRRKAKIAGYSSPGNPKPPVCTYDGYTLTCAHSTVLKLRNKGSKAGL